MSETNKRSEKKVRGKSASLRAFVDRIEEQIAVVILSDDDTVQLDLPLRYLPAGIREGDHLTIHFELAPDDMKAARKRIEDIQQELAANNNPKQKNFKL